MLILLMLDNQLVYTVIGGVLGGIVKTISDMTVEWFKEIQKKLLKV
ncbi:MAG: hypothetical protein ACT4N5_01380 [Nitrosopumilaceae archaeon]